MECSEEGSVLNQSQNHPSGYVVDDIAPTGIRPQQMHIKSPSPTPKFGAHTRELLAELRYSEDEIEALICKGVAAESWSDQYLPD